MNAAEIPYDAIDYPSSPFANSHPYNLAAMAILHGLKPEPVEQCRVLEMGCNDGANIIPMACSIPQGQFTGFDLSRPAIERGLVAIHEAGLTNIRLFQGDLLEVDAELGEFDYIVAHGVYSWVPKPVGDRILLLCRRHLAHNGVAFISYNALPGSSLRQTVRDQLLMLPKMEGSAIEQVEAGIGLLRSLAEARPQGDPYGKLFGEHLKKMSSRETAYTVHDELSAAYQPVYFTDFVQHAQRNELTYVGEASLPLPGDPSYRQDLRQLVQCAVGDDWLARDQLLDFACMRPYRETLLCRRELSPSLEVLPECFANLLFTTNATRVPNSPSGVKTYRLAAGATVNLNQPPAIAVMDELIAASPRAVPFDRLKPMLSRDGLIAEDKMPMFLLQMAIAQMIDFHAGQPPAADEIGVRPRVNAVSRVEARHRPHVSTLWHHRVDIEQPMQRALLLLLDGTRDRSSLLDGLRREHPSASDEKLAPWLEENLEMIRRAGLLESDPRHHAK